MRVSAAVLGYSLFQVQLAEKVDHPRIQNWGKEIFKEKKIEY
jgi:hypothetical protein